MPICEMAVSTKYTPPLPTLQEAVAKLEELITYRLPQSGKPLGSIVLSRPIAEVLLKALLTSNDLK